MYTGDFIGTPLAKEIAYIVEANSFERSQLWKDYKFETVTNGGHLITVGYTPTQSPVCIYLSIVKVEDKFVLFFETTSMIVDYYLIEHWMKENFPQCFKEGERQLSTDANNFHNVVAHCKEIHLKDLEDKLVSKGYNLDELDADNPYTKNY